LNELITNQNGYKKKLRNNFKYSTGICMGKVRNRIIQLVPRPRYGTETSKYWNEYYPLGCNTLYLGM
jgi:hypothetical protein